MDRNEIIERIRKVKNLAENGFSGERESAEATFERLMKTYGISDEDLSDDKEQEFVFEHGGRLILARQIIGKCIGWDKKVYGSDKDVAFVSTKDRYVEVISMFSILSASFDAQKKLFEHAFLIKNDLLAPYDGHAVSNEEALMTRKAIQFSNNIEKTMVNKQIKQ